MRDVAADEDVPLHHPAAEDRAPVAQARVEAGLEPVVDLREVRPGRRVLHHPVVSDAVGPGIQVEHADLGRHQAAALVAREEPAVGVGRARIVDDEPGEVVEPERAVHPQDAVVGVAAIPVEAGREALEQLALDADVQHADPVPLHAVRMLHRTRREAAEVGPPGRADLPVLREAVAVGAAVPDGAVRTDRVVVRGAGAEGDARGHPHPHQVGLRQAGPAVEARAVDPVPVLALVRHRIEPLGVGEGVGGVVPAPRHLTAPSRRRRRRHTTGPGAARSPSSWAGSAARGTAARRRTGYSA